MKFILFILIIFFTLNLSAKRIISLGLSSTEIITDLDSQKDIVGCDTWSKGVAGTEGAVDLGPLEKLNFDLIKQLKPDLIIVDAEFAKFGNKEKLNKTGFKITYLPNKFSKAQVELNIQTIAKNIGKETTWDKVRDDFRIKYAEFQMIKGMNSIKSKVIYLEHNYKGGMMIAGKNTAPYSIMKDAGNKLNLNINDWKTVTIEEINKLNPDVIIVTDKLVEALGGAEKAKKLFSQTKPGKEDKVIIIEDWELRNYGIYVADMLLKLMGTFNENKF